MRHWLNSYRRHLINYESILAYSVLGVVGGVASGLIVLAFELGIRQLSIGFGVGGNGESFESLPQWMIFALPAGGATLLGLAYTLLKPEDRETGIVHVLSRMHSHYSILPLRNAVVQFVGGAFGLATGQSGGREGPGVHLGGAINSLLGQWLSLPNNSLRMLIGCGTAGGIAAAFQTPLAGVLFAMEVIIAEYSVVGFIPVMLAAVSASAVSRTLSQDDWLFSLPPLELNSLLELPYIMVLGLCCGTAVAAFVRLSTFAARFSDTPVVLRFAVAGAVTGGLALLVPQILGLGYDTLTLAMHGELALTALLLIALCKLIATAVSVGVGMPLGLIGPNLLMGACIGGLAGAVGSALMPELASDPTFYAVIGMGAAMGAVLNAPLAAILAVIEMTQSLSISMAAMLAIVTATLTSTGLFRQSAAHQAMLGQLKRLVPHDPLNQLLHSTNVSSTMDTRVMRVPLIFAHKDLEPLLEFTPAWCVVERDGQDLYLVNGSELLEWLKQAPFEQDSVDLTGAGIRRLTTSPLPFQATLRQAMDTMRAQTTEAVCVYDRSENTGKQILHGVLTLENIEAYTLASMNQ
ncbi:MAG: chloride channel protein [Halioglobus sp.]|nr:chloride channel protein [Halioglobus sp.]